MKNTLIIGMVLLLALAACTTQPLNGENATNQTNLSIENQTMTGDMPANETNENQINYSDESGEYAAIVRATEEDYIQLNTRAVDPDGGEVELTFGAPFNEQGQWQTEVGDAGEYEVSITATDGVEESTIMVLVVVDEINLPPSIRGPEVIEVREGERINLNIFNITDPEGDDLVVSYSGWMNSSTYTTNFNDAGEYTTRIIAEDSQGNEVFRQIEINVLNVNRPPTLNIEETQITATEGDRIRIQATTSDPDGDEVTIEYGEPLDNTGVWISGQNDAGQYEIAVTADDGIDTVTETVSVTLEQRNRAPVIIVDEPIIVSEGEQLNLYDFVTINDPDGDEFSTEFDGWMTTSVRELTYDDAGEYTVEIQAVDENGLSTTQSVQVTVQNVNRPPVFVSNA